MASHELKRNVDFFAVTRYTRKVKHQASRGKWAVVAAVLATALAICGVAMGFRLRIAALERKIAADESYIHSPENLAEYQRLGELSGRVQALRAYNHSCEGYIAALENALRISAQDFARIEGLKPAATQITGYSFQDNAMTLTCATGNSDDPAAFAQALDGSGQFVGVKYTGFESAAQAGAPAYRFTLVVTLWEGGEAP